MWIVVTTKNINLFKDEIKKIFSDVKLYCPKIKNKNNKSSKFLLGDYVFCHSEHFGENQDYSFKIRFVRGLKRILFFDAKIKKDIPNFIKLCKTHEDEQGYIKNSFFKNIINQEGKFLNGVFSNKTFNLIEKEKNKIQVIVGNIKISISDKSNFNYSTI